MTLIFVHYCSSDSSGPLRNHQQHGGPLPPDQDGQDEQDGPGPGGDPGHPSPGLLSPLELLSKWLLPLCNQCKIILKLLDFRANDHFIAIFFRMGAGFAAPTPATSALLTMPPAIPKCQV